MERLTTRVEDKVYYSKGEYPPTTLCAEMETWEVRECMKKLAEYEDTGLAPDEIHKLNDFEQSQMATLLKEKAILLKEHFVLKKERNYWRNEALKWASELGEQKIEGGKNERNKVQGKKN